LWLALLPLFLGGVGGIHHFYTGRILFGVLQLMTAGGLFVWAIVDAFHISQGRFLDAEGRPLLA
jgi:TM2 domain-containing membrane protein YozV